MPTIAEIIAEKKAGATSAKPAPAEVLPRPTAGKPRETLAERLEAEAAMDRIDPPGKYQARPTAAAGLILRAGRAEPRGQRTEIRGPQEPEPRSLSTTAGEGIDMTPAAADAETATWHAALNAFETDLVVMRDPAEPEVCWLALRPLRPELPPILLHRLPWGLMGHPATALPAGEPF